MNTGPIADRGSNGVVPLAEASDAKRFGGKAAGLAAAMAHGLPVPAGVAFDAELVEALVRRDGEAERACAAAVASFEGARLAVRSSAVGEDGGSASFAGQHVTRLGVATFEGVLAAVAEVRASAESEGARAYRAKLGLAPDARVGVVVQRMVDAERAGVLFTKSPIDGADERVIEAAWGLGETVVAGRVVPDLYRLARGGGLLACTPGDKDVAIELAAVGTRERTLAPDRRAARCLDDEHLAALESLAASCDRAYGGPSDIEWAFEGTRLFLLQRRPVTR